MKLLTGAAACQFIGGTGQKKEGILKKRKGELWEVEWWEKKG